MITGLESGGLITFIVGLALIFFGISDNIKGKTFRLKNILISYISLLIILILFSQPSIILLFTFIGFLAGGIIFLHDDKNNLERELNLLNLLLYYSIAWMFLNKTYIWIFCCLLIAFLSTDFSSVELIFNNQYYSFSLEYIQLTIIIVCAMYQYSKVAINYFDFKNFDEVFTFLNIRFDASTDSNKQTMKLSDNHIKLLSFVLFTEDKNMFHRNKPRITFFTDIIMGKTRYKWIEDYFVNIVLNDKRKGLRRLKRFSRGYSTIEQQFLRRHALVDNSYRYTYRRKLFIELFYTKNFFDALTKRKSLTYKHQTNQKEIKKTLKKNLKYHFLLSYYIRVLQNPENKETLLDRMGNHSRVNKGTYEKIYNRFEGSKVQKYYIEQIKDARDSYYKFNIINNEIELEFATKKEHKFKVPKKNTSL